jgi:predicted nuclease with TOPRIM domain
VDGVPSHEGIQDDVNATSFCESDKTLVEKASYLVDLDKYTRCQEDESRTLFGQIRDATVDACQYQPHCVQLERENSALRYRVRQLEQSLDRATVVLLQSEREWVDTREEMLHVKEDLRRLTASQNRLKDKLQRKDALLRVRAHLLGCERLKVEKLEKIRAENVANLAWLTCMAAYLRDKAERLRRTWEDADSLHVDELFELNGKLPLESQREIRTETFELHQSRLKLHLCPMARLPTPVETEEVQEAHALVSRIFPPDYPTEDRYPVSYKRARTE